MGQESPELCVQDHTNSAIQEFLQEGTKEWYRVIKREEELVLQYDVDSSHADTPPEWKDYETIETIEIIAEG